MLPLNQSGAMPECMFPRACVRRERTRSQSPFAPPLIRLAYPLRQSSARAFVGLIAILSAMSTTRGGTDEPAPEAVDLLEAARHRMVQRHLAERGITSPRVLEAFRVVPRHRFLPPDSRRLAYEDEAIPIGEGQTLTAPFDVAFMTEVLDPRPTDRVYEVGTGSGYQAAILSRLAGAVYSVEIHAPLAARAAEVLTDLGYTNVKSRAGDGYEGWPSAAPFDKIIVTCAPQSVPPPLIEQLKEGGRMVIPLGDRFNQRVYLMEKRDGKLVRKALIHTLFVPMTGKAQREGASRP